MNSLSVTIATENWFLAIRLKRQFGNLHATLATFPIALNHGEWTRKIVVVHFFTIRITIINYQDKKNYKLIID